MWDLSTTTYPRARKRYLCDAWVWINQYMDDMDLTVYERAAVQRLGRWIMPGEVHIKVKGRWDGEWTVYRAHKELDEICTRHGLWDE